MKRTGKKSHTCEEGGAHLRICSAFTDKFEIQLFIEKTIEVDQKNVRILIFTMLYFF